MVCRPSRGGCHHVHKQCFRRLDFSWCFLCLLSYCDGSLGGTSVAVLWVATSALCDIGSYTKCFFVRASVDFSRGIKWSVPEAFTSYKVELINIVPKEMFTSERCVSPFSFVVGSEQRCPSVGETLTPTSTWYYVFSIDSNRVSTKRISVMRPT